MQPTKNKLTAKILQKQDSDAEKDLLGEEVEARKDKPVVEAKKMTPKIGDVVLFHRDDPFQEGIVSYPAIIVKINFGSVTLQVFLDTHVAAFTKIPLAEVPVAGYYTFRE